MNKRIIQLDPLLANQIAAGEVIERPASVVKELIENSLDANASIIEVEIEGAGMQLIRIRDNGNGIIKDDLALAFSRHATSKIMSVADLSAIGSLGFRGEALASIACVSRCCLISQVKEQEHAWQIQIAPDLTPLLLPAAHPIGTTIEVAELFYNVPARRKYLRSHKAEFQAIEEVFKRLALSYPQVSFRLKHQQRQVRYYPASKQASDRVVQICGQAFMEQALPVNMKAVDLALTGWIGSPMLGRRQADCQYFFINQRIVKDRLLNHAIKTLYQQQGLLIEGTYPCYVLYLNLALEEVDVNVHPTKQEVRFAHARLVHDFMLKGIQMALVQSEQGVSEPQQGVSQQMVSQQQGVPQQREIPQKDPVSTPIPHSSFPVSGRYFFLEEAEGIRIVDLKLMNAQLVLFYLQQNYGRMPTKNLLFPVQFKLIINTDQVTRLLEQLAQWGFFCRWEAQQLTVLSLPAILPSHNLEKVLAAAVPFLLTQKVSDFLVPLCRMAAVEHFSTLSYAVLRVWIQDWIEQDPEAVYLRLDHQAIKELMVDLVPSPALSAEALAKADCGRGEGQ